jgi:acyl carrier protein
MYERSIFERTCAAIRETILTPREVSMKDSLVYDLGFDSMRMATLSIALEMEFDRVVLLNDWISSADDLADLTVGSLVDYMATVLSSEDAATEEAAYAVRSFAA